MQVIQNHGRKGVGLFSGDPLPKLLKPSCSVEQDGHQS